MKPAIICLFSILAVAVSLGCQSANASTKDNQSSEEIVFVQLDRSPEFPGGDDSLFSWINQNLRYPEKMLKKKKRGLEVVDFLIGTDGTISNIKIKKSLGKEADTEVLRLLSEMPAWNPGMYQGHPVAVPFSLPVSFNIPVPKKEKETMFSWVKSKLEKSHTQEPETTENAPTQPEGPVYFVNGVLFSGDIDSISLSDIENISREDPTPEYPHGTVRITLKKK